jgi:orotate phosphoribosyltransferase
MESSQMQSNLDQERSQLKDILARKSVKIGRPFTLSSGAVSDKYVDGKLTTCFPEAMPLVGHVFIHKIKESGWTPRAVGGLTVGADPISFSVARESFAEFGQPINAFIVRKEPKKHGMERFIEGLEDTKDVPVVIIDDVCTQGKSTGEAIEKARAAGMHVLGAICLVDRLEGAGELLRSKYQCRLESIFTLSELLARHSEISRITDLVGAKHT